MDSSGNPLHFLIQAFEHTLSNTKFNYGSPIQIEKLLNLLNLKTHMDMVFSENFKINWPLPCIASVINHFQNELFQLD